MWQAGRVVLPLLTHVDELHILRLREQGQRAQVLWQIAQVQEVRGRQVGQRAQARQYTGVGGAASG